MSLSSDLITYYEKRFFFMAYPGNPERAQYEWGYSRSRQYQSLLRRSQYKNIEHGRSYTDKRTRGWKFYLETKDVVRKNYELAHPLPEPPKTGSSQTITFTRHTNV